jgi:hypothetical protein
MKRIIIIYVLILLAMISCDMTNQKLLLINNSKNNIYYRLLLDTVINSETYVSEINSYDSVRPLFANKGKNTWEYKINNKSIDSTLYIYIFYPDMKKIEFSNPRGIKVKDICDYTIGERNYIRKGFKLNDLERYNWTITYPDNFNEIND